MRLRDKESFDVDKESFIQFRSEHLRTVGFGKEGCAVGFNESQSIEDGPNAETRN